MTMTVNPAGIARRKNGAPPPDVPLADIDLGTLEFWEWDDDRRDGAFATLRRKSPITFFEVPEFAGFAGGAGHWALTTFDDIHHASRHPRSSADPEDGAPTAIRRASRGVRGRDDRP